MDGFYEGCVAMTANTQIDVTQLKKINRKMKTLTLEHLAAYLPYAPKVYHPSGHCIADILPQALAVGVCQIWAS